MKLRIGFLHHFHDSDWMGEQNYFSNLFDAVSRLEPNAVQFVLPKHNTQTSLPRNYPHLEGVKTTMETKEPDVIQLCAGMSVHDELNGEVQASVCQPSPLLTHHYNQVPGMIDIDSDLVSRTVLTSADFLPCNARRAPRQQAKRPGC